MPRYWSHVVAEFQTNAVPGLRIILTYPLNAKELCFVMGRLELPGPHGTKIGQCYFQGVADVYDAGSVALQQTLPSP